MKKGFTLVELLVVVLIIGILSAVALPQYRKAVVKSRFAEAFTNLKSIAQAHQVCFMEKGEECGFDDLAVEVGQQHGNGDRQHATKHFMYYSVTEDIMGIPVWVTAQYRDEDVCLCYLQTGEIVLSQDHDEALCVEQAPSFDYAKLLNIREAEYQNGCACC